MKEQFVDQVAVITGAGIGIGFEIARQLASQGASVILNDRDESVAKNAARCITEEGGTCIALAGDASEIHCIEHLIDTAVSTFGKLDIAIANAGITTFGDFLNYQLEDFQRLIAVNLQGSFFLAQAAAKQMALQEQAGRILLMSSATGHQVHPGLAAYSMTKSALETLAKNLAVELASKRITVNAIAPGATATERTIKEPNYKKDWERITPNGQVGSTQDIAHAALFLLSPLSGHITGQSLIIDGGWSAISPAP